MNLSSQHLHEIKNMLAAGNSDRAVERYREVTGCDIAIAKAEIDALICETVATEEATCGDASRDDSRAYGSAWTLIAAIAVFVAILGTVYFYVFPRLKGERVSVDSRLEIREPGSNGDGLEAFVLPDGTRVLTKEKALLTAEDFTVFRGDGLRQPASLTLYFSESGRSRMKLSAPADSEELIVMLNGRAIARTRLSEWTDKYAVISLPDLTSADVNEIFARLTQ
jgi:hypothetical protein